jgi:YesN/AraC family two-component response regulator
MNQLLVNLIAGSSLLIAILIFLNPNKYNILGNRWLSLFIFCIFLMNIDEFLHYNNLNFSDVKFYVFSRYCIVPVFYFTIIYYVKPTKKWKPAYFLHFIFGLLFIILEQNSTQIVNGNLVINKEVSSNFSIYFNQFLMYIVLPSQFVVYFWQCFKEIEKHNQNIKKFSSNTEEIDLRWLRHILYIIISFSFFFVIYIFTHSAIMINSLLLISLLFIGYNAMRQKEIFPYSDNSKDEIRSIIREERKQESAKKREINTEDKKVYQKLLQMMQNDKPFLNPNLSLFSLANTLDISAHNLSFIINECSGENFNQFVNRYRIEEAKKLILNPKMNHLSILGVGFEVGFNSKSVFNSTFKKIIGFTPIQYKNKNLIDKISTEL